MLRSDDERDLRVLGLWDEGLSATEVGEAVGLCKSTVLHIVSRVRKACAGDKNSGPLRNPGSR